MSKLKTIYLPDEIHEQLGKEGNASKLISELLRKHFDLKNINNMTVEQLDQYIKEVELEQEYKKQLKQLKEKTNNGN